VRLQRRRGIPYLGEEPNKGRRFKTRPDSKRKPARRGGGDVRLSRNKAFPEREKFSEIAGSRSPAANPEESEKVICRGKEFPTKRKVKERRPWKSERLIVTQTSAAEVVRRSGR